MDKAWGFIKLCGFGDKPAWIMSQRQITDEDVNALMRIKIYHIDLTGYGFGFKKEGAHFGETIRVGCTKKMAIEILEKLNDGEDPWELMLGMKKEKP